MIEDRNLKLPQNTLAVDDTWLVTKGSKLQEIWKLSWKILAYIVTLTLKIGTQPVYMSLHVRMMHQHTKFHSERFSGSEDIVRTNIRQGLEPPQ